jgi:hypothetical protein
MPISTSYNPNAPSAKTGQGSAIGNREDLSQELTLLAPEETPLLSLCAKSKATASYSEWVVDKLDSPSTDGVSEDADVTSFEDQFASRARLGNYIQKFRRTFRVSDIQNAVSSAGPADLVAAEAMALRNIKRDIEATIASSNEMQAQAGGGVKYKMRGLGKWIQDTAQATNPVPADYRTPADSILAAAPTEITLNDVIASIFTVNGEANALTCVAGTQLRKDVAEFTRTDNNASEGVYTVNQDATSRTVTLSVQLFESDFGFVRLVNGNPACMPTANTGYVINPKYLEFRTLIPLGTTRLEDQGSGERGYVDMTGTLACKHPGAHGKISY